MVGSTRGCVRVRIGDGDDAVERNLRSAGLRLLDEDAAPADGARAERTPPRPPPPAAAAADLGPAAIAASAALVRQRDTPAARQGATATATARATERRGAAAARADDDERPPSFQRIWRTVGAGVGVLDSFTASVKLEDDDMQCSCISKLEWNARRQRRAAGGGGGGGGGKSDGRRHRGRTTVYDEDEHVGIECNEDCINAIMAIECTRRTCDFVAAGLCRNQRFQRREWRKVRVVKTAQTGWGLAAGEDIEAGDFVMELVGELINDKESRRRIAHVSRCCAGSATCCGSVQRAGRSIERARRIAAANARQQRWPDHTGSAAAHAHERG
jgi:hypothetical protein